MTFVARPHTPSNYSSNLSNNFWGGKVGKKEGKGRKILIIVKTGILEKLEILVFEIFRKNQKHDYYCLLVLIVIPNSTLISLLLLLLLLIL